jgi:hypothetical protein
MADKKFTYENLCGLYELQKNFYENENNDGEDLPEELEFPNYGPEQLHYVGHGENLKNVPEVKCVCFNTFDNDNEHKIDELVDLPPSVEYIYLGHDGVVQCDSDLRETLVKIVEALPNLIWLEYCGYYCEIYPGILDLVLEETGRNIFCKEIF